MTHYYYYIEAGSEISQNSHFFRVAVGSSARAQRDFLFLIAYSVQHAHYFERFSAESDAFISQIASSLLVPRLPFVQIKAHDLVRCFKHGCAIPDCVQEQLNTAAHQDAMLNLDFYIASKILNNRV